MSSHRKKVEVFQYFEGLTDCAIRVHEGWYMPTCIDLEFPHRDLCHACVMVNNLSMALFDLPAAPNKDRGKSFSSDEVEELRKDKRFAVKHR